jgi:hypothetical protein
MRVLLTAFIAALFLTGCPEDKKDENPGKDTASETKPAASAEEGGEAKEGEEGEGW